MQLSTFRSQLTHLVSHSLHALPLPQFKMYASKKFSAEEHFKLHSLLFLSRKKFHVKHFTPQVDVSSDLDPPRQLRTMATTLRSAQATCWV